MHHKHTSPFFLVSGGYQLTRKSSTECRIAIVRRFLLYVLYVCMKLDQSDGPFNLKPKIRNYKFQVYNIQLECQINSKVRASPPTD